MHFEMNYFTLWLRLHSTFDLFTKITLYLASNYLSFRLLNETQAWRIQWKVQISSLTAWIDHDNQLKRTGTKKNRTKNIAKNRTKNKAKNLAKNRTKNRTNNRKKAQRAQSLKLTNAYHKMIFSFFCLLLPAHPNKRPKDGHGEHFWTLLHSGKSVRSPKYKGCFDRKGELFRTS